MSNLAKEFREFIERGNVVDLAVAVVLAAAFSPIVTAIVDNFIMQIVAALFGQPDFSELSFSLGEAEIGYGAIVTAIVSFLMIAVAVFLFVVKPWNALQARRAAEEEAADAGPTEAELLAEIRDLLRARQH